MEWTLVELEISADPGPGRAALRCLAKENAINNQFWEREYSRTGWQVINGIIKTNYKYFQVLFLGLSETDLLIYKSLGYDIQRIHNRDVQWFRSRMMINI